MALNLAGDRLAVEQIHRGDWLLHPLLHAPTQRIDVDFQLVCASHRNLLGEVEAGRFRQDLYYRVNGLALTLPALRDRSDQPALVAALLHTLEPQRRLALAPEVAAAFAAYRWPGNLRQLSNVLRTACALLDPHETLIERCHLPDELAAAFDGPPATRPLHDKSSDLRAQAQRCIDEVVRECNGNLSQAARRLGIGRNTLYRRLAAARRT